MFMMNDLLGEYLDKFVIFFFDDVLIYSGNPHDHVDHIRKVLGKLRHHQLYTKASKCGIMKKSVEFLGQQIYAGGMIPTRGKVESRPRLGNPTKCQRYMLLLGFCELLPMVRQELRGDCRPINIFDTEGCSVVVGTLSTACFSTIEDICYALY